MKCRDCENLGWSYDEGERIYWCYVKRVYCPDLDIERSCSDFSLKKPAIFTTLSTIQAENEKLRAELEQVKAEKDAAVESIPHECKTCVYHTVFFNGCTLDHDCTNPDGGCSNNYDRWKWRGPHKED